MVFIVVVCCMNELKTYAFSNPDTSPVHIPRRWCIHTRQELTGVVESLVSGWRVYTPTKTGRAVYHSQKAVHQKSGKMQRAEMYRANDYARITGEAVKWERAERRTTQREARRLKRNR